jgi:asparagine N-glycosylation enzyme membrane subunit Stt3
MRIEPGRKKIVLLCLFLFAVALRMLPWEHVFDSGRVYLYDPDCYVRLRKILVSLASFPAPSVYDYYEGFPKGSGVIAPPTMEYLVAALLYPFRHLPSVSVVAEKVITVIPPFIGGLTVVSLYKCVDSYFGEISALAAAVILILSLPHVDATLLGRFDNEMVEPLFLVLILWMYLRTYDDDGSLKRWVALGILSTAFLLSWRGAVFPLSVIGLDLLRRVFSPGSLEDETVRISRGAAVMYLCLAGFFALICASDVWQTGTLFSYNILSWFHVLLFGVTSFFFIGAAFLKKRRGIGKATLIASFLIFVALAALAVKLLVSDVLAGWNLFGRGNPWLNTIVEYQPLFHRGQDARGLLERYGGLFFVAPLLLIFLRSRVFGSFRGRYFLVLWTLIMLAAAIARQRFAVYHAVNAAIIGGICIYYIEKSFIERRTRHRNILLYLFPAVFCLLLLPTFPHFRQLYQHGAGFSIKGDLESSLLWLRDNTPCPGDPFRPDVKPSYGVLARWDYGGWLESVALRPVVATNYGTEKYGMEEVSRFFLSTGEDEMTHILVKNEVRYIFLDSLLTDLTMYSELLGKKERLFSEQWSPRLGTYVYFPTKEYYSLIISRLYYADGSMMAIGPTTFDPVERVRLVYESRSPANVHGFPGGIRKIKIFEYGGGARVIISGMPGKTVTMSQPIETNQGRRFTFFNRKVLGENGRVGFLLLYPKKIRPFTVGALGPAVFAEDGKKIRIEVGNLDLQQGKTFRISFAK